MCSSLRCITKLPGRVPQLLRSLVSPRGWPGPWLLLENSDASVEMTVLEEGSTA